MGVGQSSRVGIIPLPNKRIPYEPVATAVTPDDIRTNLSACLCGKAERFGLGGLGFSILPQSNLRYWRTRHRQYGIFNNYFPCHKGILLFCADGTLTHYIPN